MESRKDVNVLSRLDGSVRFCCEVVKRREDSSLSSYSSPVEVWRELCCHLWNSSENQQPFLILQVCPFIDVAFTINDKSA